MRADAKNTGGKLKVQIVSAKDQASQDHVQSQTQNFPLVASLQGLDQVAVGVRAVVDKVHL